MNPTVVRKWIDALRSRKYRQGQGRLKRTDEMGITRYCCLGVLTDLYIQEHPDASWTPMLGMPEVETFDELNGVLSRRVQNWLGVGYCNPIIAEKPATHRNDSLEQSFDAIANLLEAELNSATKDQSTSDNP